jgi:putative RecB family exonuclease
MTTTTEEALAIEFKNEHLSVSRLKLYEQCELSFAMRYVFPKGDEEPRGVAADFGVVLHAALEAVYLWIVREEYAGRFPDDKLMACYRDAFQASGLVGVALYQEGLQILRTYARTHDVVDHMTILAVEREFNLDVGGFVVNGYIDRVDKLADDWIAIVDYKSNRNLFTRDDLDTDLQMSVYGLVARTLWPWAKRFSFVFHMLRHDTHQGTERTSREIDDAAGYIVALGKRTEQPRKAHEWKPQLNANCSYCDYRRRCPLYEKILAGGHEVTKVANTADFGEVADKREELHKLAKVLYARKSELDKLIKAKLDREGEFDAGGYHYRYVSGGFSTTIQPSSVMRVFGELGIPPEETAKRVLRVDNDALEAFRVAVIDTLDRPKALILNATLQGISDKTPNTPRLDSHAIKTAKKVHDSDVANEAKTAVKEAAKRDRKTKGATP